MEEFNKALREKYIELTLKQEKQFKQYYETLIEWNQKMNLTAIIEEKEVYFKHFLDSISLFDILGEFSGNILDVGSGAGFPSIPLKILNPDIKVTIVDSTLKRTLFLKHLVKLLNFKDVDIIHARIEDFKQRESFDVVTARAVATMPILMEWCAPFVNIEGHFIAMKGPKADDEILAAKKAAKILGLSLKKRHTYPLLDNYRELIMYQKITKSPKQYPRPLVKIKKQPL